MLKALGVVALAAAAACGGNAGTSARTPAHGSDFRTADGRPPVVVVDRDGDPRGAVALAVSTDGIAPTRGAAPAVALAAIVEARLAASGVHDVRVVPSFDGYRVRALVSGDADADAFAAGIRVALLTPIDAAAASSASEKLDALAHRPIADVALTDAARCTGDVVSLPNGAPPPAASEIESWRAAAHRLGRVVVATAGGESLARAVATAIAHGDAWPAAAPDLPPAPLDGRTSVYDAARTIPPGSARATIVMHTATATRAVAAAIELGDPDGPLASRLRALDAPAVVHSVIATARSIGGCVAAVVDLAPHELSVDLSGRIATAVALARQEIAVEVSEAASDAPLAPAVAARAGDPRDAAERAAWWSLSRDAPDGATAISIAVGVAAGRDAEPADSPKGRAEQIVSDLDRATVAWQAPVVESKTRIERGQGELWLLVGSPCGVASEGDEDAGLGSLVALATAKHARRLATHSEGVEPWATAEGVGLLIHAPSLADESPAAHARRLADVAARSFAADPLDDATIDAARAELLVAATSHVGRFASALGSALSPGHPSWVSPLGTADGIGRASLESVRQHASALRAGPIRVAVLANVDAAQAAVAAHAVDRWVARHPNDARACPPASAAAAPRPGTYAVDAGATTMSSAALAIPLPSGDAAARTNAELVAAALDGADGSLGHALSSGLADTWSARIVGPPAAASLVIRISATNAQLDAAVAQTRALLDRVHQHGISAAELARAAASRDRDQLARSLEPSGRVAALWRGDADPSTAPTLDALRTYAASALDDAALVIVASRPARTPHAP
jgi:hypothetical protein